MLLRRLAITQKRICSKWSAWALCKVMQQWYCLHGKRLSEMNEPMMSYQIQEVLQRQLHWGREILNRWLLARTNRQVQLSGEQIHTSDIINTRCLQYTLCWRTKKICQNIFDINVFHIPIIQINFMTLIISLSRALCLGSRKIQAAMFSFSVTVINQQFENLENFCQPQFQLNIRSQRVHLKTALHSCAWKIINNSIQNGRIHIYMLTLYRVVKGEKDGWDKHIQVLNWFHGQRQGSTNHPVVSYYENGMR